MVDNVGGGTGLAVEGVLLGPGQRSACARCGFPNGVQFGEPADLGDQRHIFTGTRIDTRDLGERKLQAVGFLGHLTRPVGAVDQVAPRDQPLIAQFAVALDQCGDTGIPIESTALFVRTHQPELIILTVQCQQSGGECGQGLRRHAATAEIGPRRAVAADRTQRDDAAVVIAIGTRGVQDLVDRRGGGGVEVRGAESALHHRTRGTRTHPGGIRPRPAQQVQAGHHHGLAGPGLTGQDGQSAVELGGGRADRAQCVDPDLGQHLLLAPARHRQPEFAHQPVGERRAVQPHPLQGGLAFGHL